MLPYTTLHAIKQALGGPLPPFVPLSAEARAAGISTPGMGVIEQDAETKLLKCPKCGKHFGRLGNHLRVHRDIGGAQGLKRLLGYSPSTALVTLEEHQKFRNTAMLGPVPTPPKGPQPKRGRRGAGWANLHFSCEAQLKSRWQKLHDKLGHQPTFRDWMTEGYPAFNKGMGMKWSQLVKICGGQEYATGKKRKKKFCNRGHPLVAENLQVYKNNNGECKQCKHERAKRSRSRRKQATVGMATWSSAPNS